jgi:hypothetical protein
MDRIVQRRRVRANDQVLFGGQLVTVHGASTSSGITNLHLDGQGWVASESIGLCAIRRERRPTGRRPKILPLPVLLPGPEQDWLTSTALSRGVRAGDIVTQALHELQRAEKRRDRWSWFLRRPRAA